MYDVTIGVKLVGAKTSVGGKLVIRRKLGNACEVEL